MRRGLGFMIAALLAGCAGTVAPLPLTSELAPTSQYDVAPALDSVNELSRRYSINQRKISASSRWLALPTIAAAAGAAVVTLAAPSASAKVLGYIAIGAGAYEFGRASLSPKSLPELYRKGGDALACLQVSGRNFAVNNNPDGQSGVFKLNTARDGLGAQIAKAQELEKQALAGGGAADDRAAAQAAQAKLSAGLVNARLVYASSGADVLAASNAPGDIIAATWQIAGKVDRKSMEGTNVQFSTLFDQFKSMIPPPPKQGGEAGLQAEADIITQRQDFDEALTNLEREVAAVQSANATIPFAKWLAEIRACPAKVD
jgi:hypothetical protein